MPVIQSTHMPDPAVLLLALEPRLALVVGHVARQLVALRVNADRLPLGQAEQGLGMIDEGRVGVVDEPVGRRGQGVEVPGGDGAVGERLLEARHLLAGLLAPSRVPPLASPDDPAGQESPPPSPTAPGKPARVSGERSAHRRRR